jgi:CRP/FNR family transcriptional regulator, cyclic AMP receptor protein
MPEGALPGGPVPLLELDPDLGRLIPRARAGAAASALAVPAASIDPGPWDVRHELREGRATAGLLVLDGLVAQDVLLAAAAATELLGPGDFLHPREIDADHVFLNPRLQWTALDQVTVALLDARAERELAAWPEVAAALLARSADRNARLGVLRAAAHVGRVEDRLLALMWHLAGRHGRVGSGGVILPLSLRHRVLGDLVGASRSTVTLALGALERRQAIARRPEGGWLLLKPVGDAPSPRVRRTPRGPT